MQQFAVVAAHIQNNQLPIEIHALGLNLLLTFTPPNSDDWLSCDVSIEVPGFSGNVHCSVSRTDLLEFNRQLLHLFGQVGNGPAEANPISTEGDLTLTFAMDRSGRIDGHYRLENANSSGRPTLSGGFEMDQSYMPPIGSRLSELLLSIA